MNVRLSPLTFVEYVTVRMDENIATQDAPQRPVGHDKSVSIPSLNESLRTFEFVRREQLLHRFNLWLRCVQVHSPYVEFVFDQRRRSSCRDPAAGARVLSR